MLAPAIVPALGLAAALAPAATAFPPPAPSHRQAETIKEVAPGRCMEMVRKLEAFGTRHTLSATDSPTRGIGAAREWIKAELEAFSAAGAAAREGEAPLRVEFEAFDAPPSARLPKGAHIVNVVATLPGSMPDAAGRRYYIVAHYDSRNTDPLDGEGDAPGANDNASGTAVVMECARILAGRRLDATVVFLLTAGEEQGLIGAQYHVSQAIARGEQIAGVLNNDIVGDPSDPHSPGSKVWTLRIFSEGIPRNASAEMLARIRATAGENDSPSRQLARFVDSIGAQHEHAFPMLMMVARQDRFMRGGDHIPFNDAGIPAVRFTTARETYDRQHVNITEVNGTPYGDISRYIDSDYLAAVARLNVAAIINLASAPSAPADVRIVTASLDNQTVIRWSPAPEPDVIGYEVLFRQTTDPQWSDTIFDAERKTELTLKIGKDDHFFGVRSVDRDGYRSPVTFAGAARE